MRKTRQALLFVLLVGHFFTARAQNHGKKSEVILHANSFKHYIDSFNKDDKELYPQYIRNKDCWEFLSANIPLFDCPDKELEKTYYFRWWTYRKHIRKTPAGFVILEFLPDVPWAGKYNTINCAAALHIYEGRWLHDEKFLNDYSNFWYGGGGDILQYSCWMADAIWNRALVNGDFKFAQKLQGKLISSYYQRDSSNLDPNGLYWQEDGRDGMEVSVCGSQSPDAVGYRATLNSYMYGDAKAIADIAFLSGDTSTKVLFDKKAQELKMAVLKKLWDEQDHFFKVIPGRDTTGNLNTLVQCTTRELHGYSPWLFNIPSEQYDIAWKFLMDPKHFYAPYGPTTADQSDTGFHIFYSGHECQWNGPSWPFSTSVTLTSLANLLNSSSNQTYIANSDYFKLLENYSASQRKKINDKTICWIDENLNPYTGDWISRTRLAHWENNTWSLEKGGVERGKDYNHSSFCDLIISGLIGLRPQVANSFIVNPLIPENTWKYFCLDNILYHGHILSIVYDQYGNHYHRGKGFAIWIDGKKVISKPRIEKISIQLPDLK